MGPAGRRRASLGLQPGGRGPPGPAVGRPARRCCPLPTTTPSSHTYVTYTSPATCRCPSHRAPPPPPPPPPAPPPPPPPRRGAARGARAAAAATMRPCRRNILAGLRAHNGPDEDAGRLRICHNDLDTCQDGGPGSLKRCLSTTYASTSARLALAPRGKPFEPSSMAGGEVFLCSPPLALFSAFCAGEPRPRAHMVRGVLLHN